MKNTTELLDFLEALPSQGKVKFGNDFPEDDYYTAIGQLKVQTKALSLSDVSDCNMQELMIYYNDSKHVFNDRVIDVLIDYKR